MTALQQIEVFIEGHQAEIKNLNEKRDRAIQGHLIKCGHCGKMSKLGSWVFIWGHWYVEPWGCTGGDYWNADSVDNHCSTSYIRCSKCGEESRLYHYGEERRNFFMSHKYLFREVEDRHEH